MQRYVDQIVQDIKNSVKNQVNFLDPGKAKSYEEFAQVMGAMENGETFPAEQVLNIAYKDLPSPEKLSDSQATQILEALIYAFEHRDIFMDFPEKTPAKLRYELIRESLNEGISAVVGYHYDFCSGWSPDCKLLDYCEAVSAVWTEEELRAEQNRLKK